MPSHIRSCIIILIALLYNPPFFWWQSVGDGCWFLKGAAADCFLSATVVFKRLLPKHWVSIGIYQLGEWLMLRHLGGCSQGWGKWPFNNSYQVICNSCRIIELYGLNNVNGWITCSKGDFLVLMTGGLRVMQLICHFLIVTLMLLPWVMVYGMW